MTTEPDCFTSEVRALLDDNGDHHARAVHADFAAAALKAYFPAENHWMVLQRSRFQGACFFQHIDLDRNVRDQFKGHRWFDRRAEFCAMHDHPSFDRDFVSMPLEAFEPVVHKVLTTERVGNAA